MKTRLRRARKEKTKPPRIVIHPEVHRFLSHQRAETHRPIQDIAHEYLCAAIKRPDLIGQPFGPNQ